nr:natterin-3-like [Crassostrea gigas]
MSLKASDGNHEKRETLVQCLRSLNLELSIENDDVRDPKSDTQKRHITSDQKKYLDAQIAARSIVNPSAANMRKMSILMAEWASTTGNTIPDNAIRAGYDINKKALFIARAVVSGEMTPGKCGTHLEGAHIPFAGKEHIIQNYEVLVYPINALGFLDWQQASNGDVPGNAIDTASGIYIGRVLYSGSLIPCKIHTGFKVAYMGFAGKEHQSKEYEALYKVI